MKILHVITSLRTGGAEHLMVDLLPALRALGDEVELLVFDGTRTPFMEELESKGVKIHCLGTGRNVYHPLHIFKMRRFFRGYDVIHTHNTACQLFVPVAKCLTCGDAKLVTTEHNTTNRRRGKWLFKVLDKWMYSRYSRVICISDSTKENLERHVGAHKSFSTIYNGIDVQRFLQPIHDVTAHRKFVITMTAAFRGQKDQDTLIRAMVDLPSHYVLQLVGDGERREALELLIDRLFLANRVCLLGVRSDIPDILKNSDVVVLSSHWEGFGLAAVEGMATGQPVVVSDVKGLADIVQGYGVVFPRGDAKQLAHEIKRLCENPDLYREVAERCQEKAKQFDIGVMARKYHELYREL